MRYPPFADESLFGTCIRLAHASFYESLPANAQQRGPVAPAVLEPKREHHDNLLRRGLAAVEDWFYRQRLASRERYLAQAQNVFDLEARMRDLDRRPQY